jgi:hypothetical protein
MAAFDFPPAPVVGEEYIPSIGPTFVWSGKVWDLKPPPPAPSIAQIICSDLAPSLVQANLLWWDTDSGNLFVSYQDADAMQWVQVIASTGAPPGSGGGVPEAPMDGQMYGRQSASWQNVTAAGVDGGTF